MRSPPATENSQARPGLLAHAAIDAVPVGAGLSHFAAIVLVLAGIPHLPWWGAMLTGLAFAYALSWSVNGLAHNFIHTPYFRSKPLNRLFAILLSINAGSSQRLYEAAHLMHHRGNMDRPDSSGSTIDPISIYRRGRDGKPESAWAYAFGSLWRDRPLRACAALWRKDAAAGRQAATELAAIVAFYGAAAIIDWRAVAILAPFYYLGRSLSSLNGYYEHFRADPDRPIAWGVSCYDRAYNLLWFNNGYHAEHHFRPRLHWSQLPRFHRQIAQRQEQEGVRVIAVPHYLGFLAP